MLFPNGIVYDFKTGFGTKDATEYHLENLKKIQVWWGWLESNQLPSGYEPPALTDELHPQRAVKTS